MPRVKLVISYDGGAYRGSQVQPHVPTIQETLESSLQTIQAFAGRTTFAGRTDAGVHALGQVVSCDVVWERELHRLTHALNSVLPVDIRVISCVAVNPVFNARFDAQAREYRYFIAEARYVSPLQARYVWACPDWLDAELARAAVSVIEGRHSFGSFASAGRSQQLDASELERTVFNCEWLPGAGDLFPIPGDGRLHQLMIRADGFLPQMVRNITSAIVEVASGKHPREWIEYLLVSGDRRLLGPPAPPHGLVLWNVEYNGNVDAPTGNSG